MNWEHLAFCYGVWGSDPKYTVGIEKARASVNQFFPGASCIIMTDALAPGWIPDKGCWRLVAPQFAVQGVTHFMMRDADSRMTMREYFAILEWLASGKQFHFMRDHPYHHHPILGGMWGYYPSVTFSLIEHLRAWVSRPENSTAAGYGVNERFLAEQIWPHAKSRCLEHGSFNQDKYPNQIPFPTDRLGIATEGFVGEIIQADDSFCPIDRKARNA